ncbi:MAG TPA: hypothetical protein VFW05_00130 [Verrucomicrobiae bacterium]|nr:hypothetical protein [Verrucomicrobiae bacterium]
MKKLFLIATILAGAIGVSHAGVNFSIGIGIPVPPPVIISRPAPVYIPAPVYVAPCPPAVVVAPRYYPAPVVVHRYPVYPVRPAYRHDNWHHRDNHGHYGHWNNHHR